MMIFKAPVGASCERCAALMCITCVVKNSESPYYNFEEKGKACGFNQNGTCKALACYSSQVCTAKDAKGNPKCTL